MIRSSVLALVLVAVSSTSCVSVSAEERLFPEDRATVYTASMRAVGDADWWTLTASDREAGLISCEAGDSLGLWRGGGTHKGRATIVVREEGPKTSVNVRVECAGSADRLTEFWRCLDTQLAR